MVRFKPIVLLIACPLLTTFVLGGLPSRVHEFAHVADGAIDNLRMNTTIYVRNQGMTEANIAVKFYDDLGEPWMVKIGTTEASTHTAKIAANGMAKLTTAGTGELGTGWAALTADREVGAQLFFEIFEDGKLTAQAAVEPVGSMHSVELFVDFDMSAGSRTALAIVNLSDIGPVEVSIGLSDETGGDNRSGGLNVPSLGHKARFIDEIFAMEQIKKYRGTVQILADGPISVLALQQTGLVIGTLVPIQRTLIGRFGGEE